MFSSQKIHWVNIHVFVDFMQVIHSYNMYIHIDQSRARENKVNIKNLSNIMQPFVIVRFCK